MSVPVNHATTAELVEILSANISVPAHPVQLGHGAKLMWMNVPHRLVRMADLVTILSVDSVAAAFRDLRAASARQMLMSVYHSHVWGPVPWAVCSESQAMAMNVCVRMGGPEAGVRAVYLGVLLIRASTAVDVWSCRLPVCATVCRYVSIVRVHNLSLYY